MIDWQTSRKHGEHVAKMPECTRDRSPVRLLHNPENRPGLCSFILPSI